jgi:ABC-type polysaccharide/polyol phosphate transport system ATPase subunit
LHSGTVTATDVWKRFRVDGRTTYLQDQLGRAADYLRRKDSCTWRWVLRDVEFQAEPGESWALVGANGAGKSTLLKLLARVMYQTAGRVDIAGRVGALIDIRAGMAPLLTGRENIYFTGTLMGLKRKEIARRFDEIVEFAGLESAVDRQVKHYSLGMQMRLGFGVAAYLEPDVLLVDEVLAVGDATFQQRCLERMRYVLNQGTTLVLVSHDLAAIEATCTNAMWLGDGSVCAVGRTRDVLSAYRGSVEAMAVNHSTADALQVHDPKVGTATGAGAQTGYPLHMSFTLESDDECPAFIYLGVSEGAATPVFLLNPGREVPLVPGGNRVSCTVPSVPLPRGRYYLWAAAYRNSPDGQELLAWQPVTSFEVFGPELDPGPRAIVRLSPVYVDSQWQISAVGGG